MRIFNFVLTVLAAVVALLVFTNIFLGRSNASTAAKLDQAQAIVRSAPANQAALNNLAGRVNQAAATDPALKDLLQKVGINIAPSSAPAPAN